MCREVLRAFKAGLGLFLVGMTLIVTPLSPPRPTPVLLASKTPASKASLPSLSCAQIPLLERWSLEHHVVGMDNTLSSTFTGELAERILETLDPHKIVFIEADKESLTRLSAAGWREVLKKKTCDLFTNWVTTHFAEAKGRVYTDLSKRTFERSRISKSVVDSSETQFKKYKSLAVSAKDLQSRWSTLYAEVLKAGYPKLLETYGNDINAYVLDAVTQILEHKMPPGDMLAKAMLRTVDEYSNFLSADEYADFYDDLAGGTSGIGIKIRKTPKGLLVEKILEDSPAKQSKKLTVGDQILAVDGKALAKLGLSETKALLKGKAGASISLLVHRSEPSHSIRFTLKLKRQHFNFEEGKVEVSSHPSERGPILVAHIPSFYGRGTDPQEQDNSVSEDLEAALKKQLAKKKPSAILIDLRDNPGGYLEEAVDMAGLFLGNKTVAGVLERNSRRVFKNDYSVPLYDGPLVVLVDSGSASAAEVFAGAMKDHQRALIIGSPTTFGKGTVQRLYHVENELPLMDLSGQLLSGVIKLTTSVFYSPLGHSPARGGVTTHLSVLAETSPTDRPTYKSLAKIEFDVSPFLSEPEVTRLKSAADARQPLITQLREESQKRLGEGKSLSDALAMSESLSITAGWSALLNRTGVASRAE